MTCPAGDTWPADWQSTTWVLKSDVAFDGSYCVGADAVDNTANVVRTQALTAGAGVSTTRRVWQSSVVGCS